MPSTSIGELLSNLRPSRPLALIRKAEFWYVR
jgi:hypothetical protein